MEKQTSFLQHLAEHIVQNYSREMADLCIVLPNRRAGLFLRTYLGQKAGKTTWSPYIFSSEDFIIELSGLLVKDNVSLLFEFYEVYKDHEKDNAQSFEDFMHWAPALLSDFNEIDLYLANGVDIFSHLSSVKQIENWQIGENAGELQTGYLNFFASLGNYYNDFRSRLKAKGQAWQGMAFREVAEQVAAKWENSGYAKVVFAGFNALNRAEEQIFEELVAMEKAEVLLDADTYYTQSHSQEAGYFIRQHKQNRKLFPDPENIQWEFEHLLKDQKNIEIIAIPGNIGQTKIAGDILDKAKDAGDFSSWAVVLADESLLLPMLYSLPENVGQTNVTMGYPLKNTPIASLAASLFNLQENAQKLGKQTGDEQAKFYHKDVIQLFRHPYIQLLLRGVEKQKAAHQLISSVNQNNKIFLTIEDVKLLLGEESQGSNQIIETVFHFWEDKPANAINSLSLLTEMVKDAFIVDMKRREKENFPIEMEFLFSFHKINQRLADLLESSQFMTGIKAFRSIYNQLLRLASVPFYGKPLTGLQIMGMLETRNLDFENVVLVSTSEGFLPAGGKAASFLPFELKRVFGIPVHHDRDAIYAYHFYRLLQRAKNVYLVYNSETDDFGAGEKSRFITQILKEMPASNPQIKITERLVSLSLPSGVQDVSIDIQKTPEILEKLKQKAIKGFSPSSLNVYRNCSLQFYFKYIAGFSELEEVEETIAAHTFGTVLHAVLEDLYQPYKGKVLEVEQLKNFKSQVEPLTRQVFAKEYKSGQLDYGKNLLSLKVAIRYINRFIDDEIKRAKKKTIEIVALEQHLEKTLELDFAGAIGKVPVKFYGNADRIEKENGQLKIIDYKTGRADAWELNVRSWEDFIENTKLNKAFQLLLYAYMYPSTEGEVLNSGIITFRELGAGIKPVLAGVEKASQALDKPTLDIFEEQLLHLVSRMFNPQIPFSQTTDLNTCSYCPFKDICNR